MTAFFIPGVNGDEGRSEDVYRRLRREIELELGRSQFASNLQEALNAAGFDVEMREPSAHALYNTTVHIGLMSSIRRDLSSVSTARERCLWRPQG